MNHTNDQIKELIRNSDLQNALVKMLPQYIEQWAQGDTDLIYLTWKRGNPTERTGAVLNTELLHLCGIVEAGLTDATYLKYGHDLMLVSMGENRSEEQQARAFLSATWQQRVTDLAAVKGIELPKEDTPHRAIVLVHTVQGPEPCCEKHALKLTAIMTFMGAASITSVAPEGSQCNNCINEDALPKEQTK